jgi:23S rRNA pseudouridine1911/1915/1917 synthase
MLHARALRFDDPAGGSLVAFEAPLPADMVAASLAIAWNE